MNQLLKASIKSSNVISVKIILQSHDTVFKRNFGYVRQCYGYRMHNEHTGQLNISKRFNSTDAIAVTAAPVDLGFFGSFYQSLSNSTPVAYVQQGLVEIHDFTGLPWWASIIATTFIFRTIVTLPLTIYQHKITARIEKISLEMPAIVDELKKEAAMAMRKFKWTEKQTKMVYQRSVGHFLCYYVFVYISHL